MILNLILDQCEIHCYPTKHLTSHASKISILDPSPSSKIKHKIKIKTEQNIKNKDKIFRSKCVCCYSALKQWLVAPNERCLSWLKGRLHCCKQNYPCFIIQLLATPTTHKYVLLTNRNLSKICNELNCL